MNLVVVYFVNDVEEPVDLSFDTSATNCREVIATKELQDWLTQANFPDIKGPETWSRMLMFSGNMLVDSLTNWTE